MAKRNTPKRHGMVSANAQQSVGAGGLSSRAVPAAPAGIRRAEVGPGGLGGGGTRGGGARGRAFMSLLLRTPCPPGDF
jgi:hypothetical protein